VRRDLGACLVKLPQIRRKCSQKTSRLSSSEQQTRLIMTFAEHQPQSLSLVLLVLIVDMINQAKREHPRRRVYARRLYRYAHRSYNNYFEPYMQGGLAQQSQ
jgi:hypothetical protein